jgi:hypothetical protein
MNDRPFLNHLILLFEDRSNDPLILPWPSPGNIGGFLSFSAVNKWRDFVFGLSLDHAVPEVVAAKFRRAQKLFFLGWIDTELITVGELVGLTALELALKDRYGNALRDCYRKEATRRKKRGIKSYDKLNLSDLLAHMCKNDGLTDQTIPMFQRYGGTIVGRLTGESKPSLAEIRNSLAHGDSFDGLPCSGLLELIRDLIHYAYRDIRLLPQPEV